MSWQTVGALLHCLLRARTPVRDAAREGGELRGALHQEHMLRPVRPREYEVSVVSKLGEDYPRVLALLEDLAERLTPEDLNHRGYRLYEQFAPMVRTPGGQEATPRFGQRGIFEPAKVERLAQSCEGAKRKDAGETEDQRR
jgi:hypothetical protein